MGLRETVQKNLGEAFDTTLADAVRSLVFVDPSSSSYDPATGVVTPSALRFPTRGVVEGFTAREVANSNGAIRNKDLQVILLANEVDAAVLAVGMSMEIVGQAETYSIEQSAPDPAGASWTLQVRS